MADSFISQATKAFKDGRYLDAYDYYVKAGRISGMDTVDANLRLCLKKHASGNPFGDLPLHELKIACIMDDFTWNCYKYECNLYQLTPDNGINELEEFQPHLLFVESAWRGKNELWNKKIAFRLSKELLVIVDWCKKKHIPTLFWNKEDPVHFDHFIQVAKLFDFVFTTDIDCLPEYKKILKHERVFLLPFACQPAMHNPIERYKRQDKLCFAGSYSKIHPERTKDFEREIKTLLKYYSVDIYDRNLKRHMNKDFQFPEEYHNLIKGTLPFEEIDKAYKGYTYAFNLNSIKKSKTMFSRRVYELLASNTITFSNFSVGVKAFFGDLVFCSDNGEESVQRLKSMDDLSLRKLRLAGVRKVMKEHCYEDRLAYLEEKIFGRTKEKLLPNLVVIAYVQTQEEALSIIMTFAKQTFGQKRLLLFTSQNNQELASIAKEYEEYHVTLYFLENVADTSLRQWIKSKEWVTFFHAQDWYGSNYLLDLMLATRYSPTPVIGKGEYWTFSEKNLQLVKENHAYHLHEYMPIRRCLIRADVLNNNETIKTFMESSLLIQHYHGLSIDPFNYCELGGIADSEMQKNKIIQKTSDSLQLDTGIALDPILYV